MWSIPVKILKRCVVGVFLGTWALSAALSHPGPGKVDFPFDLVPLEQKQNLAVAEQTDRGRGGRITFEIAARPFGCLNIRACEDRYHILWPDIILKRKREAGSRTTRSASADRIDHHHDGTLCAGDGSVDSFRRPGFPYSDVCEVLPHWFDQQF
jgi:hypothetical protein